MSILIPITFEERDEAHKWGKKRNDEAIASGRQNAHGLNADEAESISKHVLGALGELAVKKHLNISGDLTINTYKTMPDVGEYEVRTRKYPNYDLNIRMDDPDDRIFILVVCQKQDMEIKGWIRGSDGKKEEWLRNYGGRELAYFVPQSELNPIELLSQTANTQKE